MSGEALRKAIEKQGPDLVTLFAQLRDDELLAILGDLGGHDMASLLAAYRAADAETAKPSVVFAYTVKGFGLPIAGDPLNHSALLTGDQISELRAANLLTVEDEWSRFAAGSPERTLCEATASRLHRHRIPVRPATTEHIPRQTLGTARKGQQISTQEAFGRILTALARSEAAKRIVTVSPDVSVSTNLGGWINKVGVFAPQEPSHHYDEGRALRWAQSPAGQHIELGISEMNFFSMIGQLGLTDQLSGETLLPIGTVYDPFVCRGLDAFIYGLYNRSKFIVAGTPSGITLAAEGGAHQSTVTASIGVELPNVVFAEPAYAAAVDWLICAHLEAIASGAPDAESLYLRLSTRPIDQAPFAQAADRIGADALRGAVLAGGYRLREASDGDGPRVQLVGSGAVMGAVVRAAEELADEGISAAVIDVTSLDLLYRGWATSRRASVADLSCRPAKSAVHGLLEPGTPIVTVHDAASHAMAWLGSVHGSRVVPLGVDAFGQSGTVSDLHRHFDLDTAAVVNAALVALAQE
jgi:pyruvate dehydrogenase E1 component